MNIGLINLMSTMYKIDHDLENELQYMSMNKDNHTTGRFTKGELETIYDGANSLLIILQHNKRDYSQYIYICKIIKAKAQFIYFNL